MPLQDHFRPPLNLRRHWHAFHNAWATYLASHLNALLPEGYFAEPNVEFGVEIDVATFEEAQPSLASPAAAWAAPAPMLTVPISILVDCIEVAVFNQEAGPTLVGAIELVSPANKDRPANRQAFVNKCAAYLQQGIGLLIVDVVTSRKADLRGDLLTHVDAPPGPYPEAELFAVAYRPIQRNGHSSLDIWEQRLEVRGSLPTLPLWLRGDVCLPIDLEATYDRTCREQRLLIAGDGGSDPRQDA